MSDYEEARQEAMSDFVAENCGEYCDEAVAEFRAKIVAMLNDKILDPKADVERRLILHEIKLLVENLDA